MINVDRLTTDAGKVFEPVPEHTRKEFRLWRGAHLGVIAANLLANPDVKPIGPFEDLPVLFAVSYQYAQGVAGVLASEDPTWQWEDEAHGDYLRKQGITLPPKFPSVVIALANQHFDQAKLDAVMRDSHPVPFIGFDTITVEMLDPYSQEFIQEFFA